jgi:hypothetical protein
MNIIDFLQSLLSLQYAIGIRKNSGRAPEISPFIQGSRFQSKLTQCIFACSDSSRFFIEATVDLAEFFHKTRGISFDGFIEGWILLEYFLNRNTFVFWSRARYIEIIFMP